MARKKIIAGNWKMNMTPSEAVKLVETLKPLVVNDEVDVVFCVPAIDIIPVVEAAKGTNIQVGAENMYFEEKGTSPHLSSLGTTVKPRRTPVKPAFFEKLLSSMAHVFAPLHS